MKPKIIFLYSELAGYFLACAKELLTKGLEVHIVRWPVNKEAPYQFKNTTNIAIYNKEDYSTTTLIELVKNIKPNLIVASGWMDKDYLSVCRYFKNKIPTVMSMDNHWKGNPKQYIACLFSKWFLHNTYSHLWIPGQPQYKYAKKLGFTDDQILTGFYAADLDFFSNIGQVKLSKQVPHRFLYVGRYVKQKGLDTLFSAFCQLQQEAPNDWELWCIGTGPLKSTAPLHHKIKHFGFKQPAELPEYISQTGVFILPSRYEPWGLVVHEMTAASMPIIVSDKVGSAINFVRHNENGYIFRHDDISDLKLRMLQIINTPSENLLSMASKSHQLGLTYSPKMWAEKITQLL